MLCTETCCADNGPTGPSKSRIFILWLNGDGYLFLTDSYLGSTVHSNSKVILYDFFYRTISASLEFYLLTFQVRKLETNNLFAGIDRFRPCSKIKDETEADLFNEMKL